jgi:hypothetical protein
MDLAFCDTVHYLGMTLKSGLRASVDFKHRLVSFYKAVSMILRRTKFAESELVSVFLLKNICLPILLYGLEVACAAPSHFKNLDRILDNAVRKIFGVSDPVDTAYIRRSCGIPYVVELRTQRVCMFLYNVAHKNSVYSTLLFRIALASSDCIDKSLKAYSNTANLNFLAEAVRDCAALTHFH